MSIQTAPLRVCVESEGDRAVVRVVNNRGYWQLLRSDAPFVWGHSRWKALDVNGSAHSLAKSHFLDGSADFIILPPLSEVSLAVASPGPGRMVNLRSTMNASLVTLTIALEALGKLGGSKHLERGLVKVILSCFGPVGPMNDAGPAAVGWMNGIVGCMTSSMSDQAAFEAVLADSITSDEAATLLNLKRAFVHLDRARMISTLHDFSVDLGLDAGIGLWAKSPVERPSPPTSTQGAAQPPSTAAATPPKTERPGDSATAPSTTAPPPASTTTTTRPKATTTSTTEPHPKPVAKNLRAYHHGGGHVGVTFEAGWQSGHDPIYCYFIMDGKLLYERHQCGVKPSRQFYGIPRGTHTFWAYVEDRHGVRSNDTNKVTLTV